MFWFYQQILINPLEHIRVSPLTPTFKKKSRPDIKSHRTRNPKLAAPHVGTSRWTPAGLAGACALRVDSAAAPGWNEHEDREKGAARASVSVYERERMRGLTAVISDWRVLASVRCPSGAPLQVRVPDSQPLTAVGAFNLRQTKLHWN